MIKFNPENKKHLNYGETLGPAMKIEDEEEALQYLIDYIDFIKNDDPSINDNRAEGIAKSNLGYYAGYYDEATQKRVQRLFMCSHPIFGSKIPTPEDALRMGFELAKKMKINTK